MFYLEKDCYNKDTTTEYYVVKIIVGNKKKGSVEMEVIKEKVETKYIVSRDGSNDNCWFSC